MASEVERAVEYRRMMVARVNAKIAREKALYGDPEYFKLLKEAWGPLIPDGGWNPPPGPEDEK